MNEDLEKMIKENNFLLKENLDLAKKNAKIIKKIQSHMRRVFITKIIYWLIIILIAFGAFYAIQPYVLSVIDKYNDLQNQIHATQEIIQDPTGFIKDVNLVNSLFNFKK